MVLIALKYPIAGIGALMNNKLKLKSAFDTYKLTSYDGIPWMSN